MPWLCRREPPSARAFLRPPGARFLRGGALCRLPGLLELGGCGGTLPPPYLLRKVLQKGELGVYRGDTLPLCRAACARAAAWRCFLLGALRRGGSWLGCGSGEEFPCGLRDSAAGSFGQAPKGLCCFAFGSQGSPWSPSPESAVSMIPSRASRVRHVTAKRKGQTGVAGSAFSVLLVDG